MPRELDGDQADRKSRGDGHVGRRRNGRILALIEAGAKGRGRNIKIPDDMFDALRAYALKSKLTLQNKHGKNYVRSMTVSEATCKAIGDLLADANRRSSDKTAAV